MGIREFIRQLLNRDARLKRQLEECRAANEVLQGLNDAKDVQYAELIAKYDSLVAANATENASVLALLDKLVADFEADTTALYAELENYPPSA